MLLLICALFTLILLAALASTWAIRAPVNELLVEDKTADSRYVYCASSYENSSEASLKPVNQLQVGDEVLAFAEWQSKGNTANRN